MSEARLSDLNFGHLGKPIYDSNSREWQFARRLSAAQRLKPVGQPVIALEGSTKVFIETSRNAPDRWRTIKDLTQELPELAPAAFLLSDLAQTSDAVNEVTAGHDPTVSELLAFGEAVEITRERRGQRTIPIVAVTAGAAGEFVRLVRLTPTQLGWDDSEDAHLDCMTARGGEEGFWMGNGSPVQQVVFAEAEGKPSHWLAVRYHGAISILRPLLLRNADISASYDEGTHPASRLDANHTLTLAEQNGVPFSDLCFNPWNNQQFGTIDQEGRWTIWDIDVAVNRKRKGHGTVVQRSQGQLPDAYKQGPGLASLIADGWNRVLWVGAKDTVAVASRRTLAIYDIGTPVKMLHVIDMDQGKEGDWLLDMKQCWLDASSLFVVTSSRIFWIRVSSAGDCYKSKDMKPGASILLSWDHSIDREDISLRLNILGVSNTKGSDNDATSNVPSPSAQDRNTSTFLVLLYSRLSGLIMNFAFHRKTSSSEQALSAVDPYIFRLSVEYCGFPRSGAVAYNTDIGSQISDIIIKVLHYNHRNPSVRLGRGETELGNHTMFYQLSVLLHDSTLSEVLCAEVEAGSTVQIHPPDVVNRKSLSKSSAKVFDDFIVPDEYCHQQGRGRPIRPPSSERSATDTPCSDEYQWALSLEWLQNVINSALAAPNPDVDEVLEDLYDNVKERFELDDGLSDTLSRIANTGISVFDIDKAAAGLIDFLGDIAMIPSGESKENANDEGKRLHVSNVLTPPMKTALGLQEPFQLSDVYDSLIKAWIGPLPGTIPGRTRIALEKVLRDVVIQMYLSTYQVRMKQGSAFDKQAAHDDRADSRPQFVLPVREPVATSSLATSSLALESSQASLGDLSSRPPLPPAQLVPELIQPRRRNEPASSLVDSEDKASRRLKALARLKPQPALPTKMSNLLNQWELGADPATYDWEAAQQAFNIEDANEDKVQTKQSQRSRKRRKWDITMPPSQPSPKGVGGSQPQSAQETQGSSQQTQNMVIQSQVEPGRFGGRPDQAKHPKHRKGF
ncbi:hypothetical protein JMJ35_003056 [Cladonia borealis]|uniref:RNA polymerase I-specific transcription initiation factor RRN6-like protein n=1 Tax=Cladonia borealis TaxID=184061 RepID=A0AA39V6L5_9LECA|nr:hypothetical protein JMJ35_003056 [Cladonia borealis]